MPDTDHAERLPMFDIVRSGSLAANDNNVEAVRENIIQILNYCKKESSNEKDFKQKIKSIVLNTPYFVQPKEKKITNALLKNKYDCYDPINIPVNFAGAFFKPSLFIPALSTTILYTLFVIGVTFNALASWNIVNQIILFTSISIVGILLIGLWIFSYSHVRRMQYHKAANALLIEYLADQFIKHIQCASGQDRTGTVLLLAYTKYIKEYLRKANYSGDTLKEVENWLVVNLHHPQFMATISSPGSEGLKKDSRAPFLLEGEYPSNLLYTQIAGTNKETKMIPRPDNAPDLVFIK